MELRERTDATETELLDRFGRVQAPNRKGAVGKDRRKSRSTSLPEDSNESEEMKTSTHAPLNRHTSRTYF